MRLSISGIIEAAKKERNKGAKIAVLRKHDSLALRRVLKFIFDENLIKLLPDSNPPYKKNPHSGSEMVLYSQARTLKIYIRDGGYNDLAQYRREMLFIELLEALDAKDAELLCAGLDENPKIGIGKKIIYEAFPDLNETNMV